MGWTATQNWEMAVCVLAIVGATVAGYVVSCLVPAAHYPRTFGWLTAAAIMAGLTIAGVKPVADILAPFIAFSPCVVLAIYAWRESN